MRRLWYFSMRFYLKIGFIFFFKRIIRTYPENVPKNKPILFVSNHQNALIDPLLIGVFTPGEMYFLTRSGVFKNPFIAKILYSVNMLPVYRIRDGYKELNKNHAVFEKCFQVLKENIPVLIFPEGSHNIRRKIRPLSKGFTRIAFGFLEKNPEKDLLIIPIGLNYSDTISYPGEVNIVYGKPISVKPFWQDLPESDAIQALKDKVSTELKKITVHIEDSQNYDKIVRFFDKKGFINPEKVNKKLKTLNIDQPIPKTPEKKKGLIYYLLRINSFIPFMIWDKIKPGIKEDEFILTFKYTIAVTAFPIFYLLQSLLLGHFTNSTAGVTYFILSGLLVLINTKTAK